MPQTDLDDAQAAQKLAQGTLQEAKANLKLARIDLNYTTIEAPITGRTGSSFFKKGDLVGPSSDPLATIVQMDPIRVVFSVGEKERDIIQKALTQADNQKERPLLSVDVVFPDQRTSAHKGQIEFVNNSMDQNTGTMAIWARFDNPQGRLIPGEYVNVFVHSVKADMQPTVPQVAVQRDREGAFVYMVDPEGKVQKRRIQTGASLGDEYVVTFGLHPGDSVIVQGLQKATPGMRVKTQNVDHKDG